MFALPGYDAFLGFLLIAAAVPVLALVTNKLLAPKSRAGERQLTYESGMEPIGGAWIQFNIRYYMFALVFVIFDVETVFLYPWAVAFNRLGLLAFIEALIFIAILLVALAKQRCKLDEATGGAVKQWPKTAESCPIGEIIKAGENDVFTQLVGYLRGTDGAASGLPQVANGGNRW